MFAFNRFRAFGRLGPRGKVVGQVRGLRRFFVLTLSVVTAASTFLVFELSSPASASPNPQVTPILAGVAQPEVEAVDGSNNLYVYNDADGTITVLPSSSGTIFGQAVTANVAVQLEPSGGTLLPGVVNGMAFDSAGDLSSEEQLTKTSSSYRRRRVTSSVRPSPPIHRSYSIREAR